MDEQEVQRSLNFVEQIANAASGQDDYMAAILMNQKLLAQGLLGMGAFSGNKVTNVSQVDKDNLPEGLTGTSVEAIENGARGNALFDVGGSKIEARVKASGEVDKNEAVVVIDDDNLVRPSPSTQDTFNVQVQGLQGAGNNQYHSTESELPVTSTEEEKHSWDFVADEIAIYGFDAPIYVAFNDPENDDRLIPLSPEDEPFSLSISTSKIHYRKQSPNDANTSINVIALK